MKHKKLKVLIVSAEVAPFAKVGGLADVAGALPRALKALGHDVRIAMPMYQMIVSNPSVSTTRVLADFPVQIRDGAVDQARILQTELPAGTASTGPTGVPVYLVGNSSEDPTRPGYFTEAVDSPRVYTYRPEPYAFFSRAILEFIERMAPAWKPDVIHCNDWHTGLLPVYLKLFYGNSRNLKKTATVFTIHNLAYQGTFPPWNWKSAGLPDSLYTIDGLEFCGDWSFMKAGLIYSDKVNTVSPTYAEEIRTSEYGAGLEGLMETLFHDGKLSGILNGIDFEGHNPQTDPALPCHFNSESLKGKAGCKAYLQSAHNLPERPDVAVIGLISRLADQKGLDLIQKVAEKILQLPVQFIVLGLGDPRYEQFFMDLQERYPDQVRANLAFDLPLAQRIYAGCDLFLMPSRFEPCGLGQLFALRYGTIPIVRATGGLADTVFNYDSENREAGNGFVFNDYRSGALLDAVQRAVAVFNDHSNWPTLVRRAMESDHSWELSSKRYVELYLEAASASPKLDASL